MSNEIIDDLAIELLEETNKNLENNNSQKYGIDPITIIICISILVNVIRVIQECRKEKDKDKSTELRFTSLLTEVRYQAINSSWLGKRRIRKIIKEKLTKEQYQKYGEAMLKALLAIGTKATEEQVSSLMEYSENV